MPSFCFAGLMLAVVAPLAVAADELFDPGRDAAADLKTAEAQEESGARSFSERKQARAGLDG